MAIKKLRKKIDSIDSKVLNLLNKRAGVILEIGRVKKRSGQPIYVKQREGYL